MPRFRWLAHTADIGFEAFGRTREEVFANSALALADLVIEPDDVQPQEEITIQVEGRDAESLLVNWLSEILYLHDSEKWLLREFEILKLNDRSLLAKARGEKFDRARHRIKLMVKAITYHQLKLEKTPEGWRAQVYVDI
ncbi:MAG TPA: archease [Terriglobia bacterium]|jgi:SHS2 domain-containing protein|nr:archease [Terriglobia bacterium]